jgi:hypothetical protein
MSGAPATETPSAPVEETAVIEKPDSTAAAPPPAEEKASEPETSAAAKESTAGPTWPQIGEDHPISILLKELPLLLEETGHNEVYGITLDPAGPFHTKLILQKFLRASANDVEKAKAQLKGTLAWRKEFKPEEATKETFPKDRFGGLGYVTVLEGVPGSENKTDVCTFNIYGAVKNNQQTFGNIDEYVTTFPL